MAQKRRGRVVGWLATGSLVVLIVGAVLGRDLIFERWHIHRLKRGNAEEAIAASAELGRLRSGRGLRELIRLPAERDVEWTDCLGAFGVEPLREIASRVLPDVVGALDSPEEVTRSRALSVLEALGGAASEAVVRVAKRSASLSANERVRAVNVLSQAVVAQPDVLTDIIDALRDHDEIAANTIQYILFYAANESPELIGPLLSSIEHPSETMRYRIVQIVGSIGSAAAAAIPKLEAALEDASPRLRSAALTAIASMRELAVDSVPKILARFADVDSGVRDQAAKVAAFLTQQNESLLDAIRERLSAPRAVVRRQAVLSLSYLGEKAKAALPDIVAAARDSDPSVRQTAMDAFPAVAPASDDATDALIRGLDDADSRVKTAAVQGLGMIQSPEHAKRAVPALARKLSDEDIDLDILGAFRTLSHRFGDIVLREHQILESENERIREIYVSAIAGIDGSAEWLVAALGDASPRVRLMALLSLKSEESIDDKIFAAVLARLDDEESDVRTAAAEALAALTPQWEGSIASLRNVFESGSERQRIGVALACGHMGSTAAPFVDLIARAATDDASTLVREQATFALGHIAIARDDLVDVLFRALLDDEPSIPPAARNSLGLIAIADLDEMKGRGRGVASVLRGFESENPIVRSGVLDALIHVDPAITGVKDAFLRALSDSDVRVRRRAADQLVYWSDPSGDLGDALSDCLTDEHAEVRVAAASSLERFAEVSSSVVPRLVAALDDADTDVREAAGHALIRIAGASSERREEILAAREKATGRIRSGLDAMFEPSEE